MQIALPELDPFQNSDPNTLASGWATKKGNIPRPAASAAASQRLRLLILKLVLGCTCEFAKVYGLSGLE